MSKRKSLIIPDGYLAEEFIAITSHHIERGRLTHRVNETMDGEYTGRFRFCYNDGRVTRWYRIKYAPRWLAALYQMVTGDGR